MILSQFKERKLAEFQNKFSNIQVIGEPFRDLDVNKEFLEPYKQFISDLIDEMEKAIPSFWDDPWKYGHNLDMTNSHNECRDEFLTNLNS